MDVQGKKTKMIRVCWERDGIREETWEPESHMRSSYPGLFPSVVIPTDVDVNSGEDSCLVGESCHNLGPVWINNEEVRDVMAYVEKTLGFFPSSSTKNMQPLGFFRDTKHNEALPN